MNNEALDYPAVTESPAELGRELASIANACNVGQPVSGEAINLILGKMLLSKGASPTDALALAVAASALARTEKDKVPLYHAGGWINEAHILDALVLHLVGVLEKLSGESRSEFLARPITIN